MPVYEYHCPECNGVFELLRPVREASNPQPCPNCDSDARRLMPTDFNAFVVREGLPRRIPDTGKYWTAEGLSDFAETGDAYKPQRPEYRWDATPFVTSEDDDREEWRQRYMAEEHERANDLHTIPDVDMTLAQHSQDYREKVVQTEVLKKKLKRPTNTEVTPRTRTGSHVPSNLAKKNAKK